MEKRDPYKCFKTSREIIQLAVMLEVRFPLSLRNVEDLLHERGIDVTRWQIYDWRKQIRKGKLVLPESVAALPVFAELVVDESAVDAPTARGALDLEIVVGDVVIRAGADADEDQLTRAIRAARAAAP